MIVNLGWKCPSCGGCYSPMTPQCYNCTGRTYTSDSCEEQLHLGRGVDCQEKQDQWIQKMGQTVPLAKHNGTGRTYSGYGTECVADRKTWTHEAMAHAAPQSHDSDQDLDTFILSRSEYTISPAGKISPKVDIK